MKSISNQKGVFAIEMAFVLLAMTAFLFFIFDLGFQVVQKSQLHRTSYALVSVLKERKAFYTEKFRNTNWDIDELQAEQMLKIAKELQANDKSPLRINIGFKNGVKDEQNLSYGDSSITCDAKPIPNSMTQGTKHDLNVYRVTVCKRIPAFYEKTIGSQPDKTDRVLNSTSTFVGR